MSFGHLGIDIVMGRCYLYRPCSKLWINHLIGYYLQIEFAVNALGFDDCTDVFLVSFIIGMNRDSCIAKLGFWSGGGQSKRPVFHIVEWCFSFLVDHLDISKARAVGRAVIY